MRYRIGDGNALITANNAATARDTVAGWYCDGFENSSGEYEGLQDIARRVRVTASEARRMSVEDLADVVVDRIADAFATEKADAFNHACNIRRNVHAALRLTVVRA